MSGATFWSGEEVGYFIHRHTLKGLEYIHRCGVIHTDVKLENVLICRHDMTALVQEASQAHLAFSEQKGKLESLSKSQKKRLKKKNKKAAETADAKASDEEKAEDGPSAAGEAPEVAEVGDGEVNGNGGYCQSNGNHVSPAAPGAGLVQPVPPVRQRERFSTLKLEEAFAKLADFGNGIKVMDKAMFENLGKHCKHCNAATFWLQKVQLHASLPIEHLEAMELAMAPTEGLEQMPMHVPIGNLGQQVSMQPLSQQQQQLLQQINQKTVNQQHLQTLLLQQALQGTPQQSPQAQAQLPNLLTGRMLDPTGSLPTKTGTMPGVALPGGAVPAFYPWIYPLDPSMVGGGVLPGAWGVVNMQGSGGGLVRSYYEGDGAMDRMTFEDRPFRVFSDDERARRPVAFPYALDILWAPLAAARAEAEAERTGPLDGLVLLRGDAQSLPFKEKQLETWMTSWGWAADGEVCYPRGVENG
eukprot:s1772_g11.t1